MEDYRAPLTDMKFIIEEWLQAPTAWSKSTAYSDIDISITAQVLEEAEKFVAGVLAPLNASGDAEGCSFREGEVRAPQGFPEAYCLYVEGGWPTMVCEVEDGGQGLPHLLNAAVSEMFFSCNHAWAMYTGIAHGAYECLRIHGSADLRETYLPGIVSGTTLPTMCLTEPQAGSDVGLLRAKAEPQTDGSYRLFGTKIFISGAEHDLTDNIVHLVLARLPDAPKGTRGISLFLVPKFVETQNGRTRNSVVCTGIEEKMGIHGSPTCSLSFEGAKGWLIGTEHAGLSAMFVMMNSARLHVGLQGLGHAQRAMQLAKAYAGERRQMRAVTKPEGELGNGPDVITYHPIIRRSLLEMQALIEGMRAIGYWTAHSLDMKTMATDSRERQRLEVRVGLLTPVIKSFFSEQGFKISSQALQVFGGYGYIKEYGIEQIVRDSRVVMLYEGTNEIQANDLLVRKVYGDSAAGLKDLFTEMLGELQRDDLYGYSKLVESAAVRLLEITEHLLASNDPERPYRIAKEYLAALALILIGYSWAKTVKLGGGRSDEFWISKLNCAKVYFTYVWQELDRNLNVIADSADNLPFLA